MPSGNLQLDNMGAISVDPTQYMAPMDLYESIWGGTCSHQVSLSSPAVADLTESPDPWNSGMDSLNFDFLAQPPPGQPQQQFYF